MKIAKKVLSVLLAIAMVLGTFAVAASANGNPDTASHQVKIWLTATSLDSGITWTSNSAMKPTKLTYTDSQTGDMEVEPGQFVMITLHMTANYYGGQTSGIVYMDSRLLDAGEIYTAQRGVAATAARTNKCITWNTKNTYIAKCNTGFAVRTVSSVAIDSGIADDYTCSAKDDGTCVFGNITDAASARSCGWDYFKYFISANMDNAETVILDDKDNGLISFPVQIPEDAAPGTQYKFMMPEENITRKTNTKGRLYLSECPDGDASADNVNDNALKYFNEDQYFDLSGTNITLTVKGGSTEINYSALQAKYDEVKDTVVDNYNNTAAFVSALADAKTILDNKNAESQKVVDDALAALTAGYNALEIKSASYTKLEAAKTQAAAIKADDYEQDANWTAFQTAYSAAQAIASGLDITHQTEIDNAATALTDAIAKLTPKAVEEDADYTALKAEIATSQNIVDTEQASWYTEATWSAFTTALANAKAVPEGLKKSSQSVIDNAKKALTDARNNLTPAAADYSKLDALITECDALNQADYEAAEWVTFANALADAKAVARDLTAKNQSTIDNAYNALLSAKNALKLLGGANYSALIAEINKGTTYAQDFYTEESWAAYTAVLAEAQAMVDAGNLKSNEQVKVDEMEAKLVKAKGDLELVGASYAGVETALARIPADADLTAYYTTATAEAVVAARTAVVYGLKKNEQARVDAFAKAINDAVDALKLIPADTTKLKAAMDKAEAIDQERYTSVSYKDMMAVYDTAKALYDTADLTKKDNQAEVDAKTAELETAIKNLVPAGADYSKVVAAIEKFEALTESHYTAPTWAAAKIKYDAAVEANGKRFTIDQQAELDAYADELNAAIEALVEAPAVFTTLDSNISKLETITKSHKTFLTDEYLANVEALLATCDKNATEFRALKAKDQALVDAKNEEVLNLYNNREYKAWDYTAINAAKAEYEAIDRTLYTDESLAVVDAIFSGIKWDYTQNPTERRDAAAQDTAVKAWRSSLVEKETPKAADYTELDKALEAAKALLNGDTSIYTDDSVKTLTDAVAAGDAVSRDLLEADQAIVDAAAAAINAAMPLTEKAASYTELDKAIALANAVVASDYTEDSYNAMATKLAAAKAVARDLKISDQAIIDKAANELNAAIAALAKKPVETKGSIVDVSWTPSESILNTFTFKVNYVDGNYASKIQLIDIDGNTRTYNRYHNAVTIKTYTADGVECSDMDRNAAYDVWTINTKTAIGTEMTAIAKYDYTWETKDLGYKFTVKLVEKVLDTQVYSVTPSATEGAKGRIPVTVVTGMDVKGVRMVMSNGATLTYKNPTVSGNQKTFECELSAYNPGVNVIKVQIKYNNTWNDYTEITYTVK